jgi:hypothetical protein
MAAPFRLGKADVRWGRWLRLGLCLAPGCHGVPLGSDGDLVLPVEAALPTDWTPPKLCRQWFRLRNRAAGESVSLGVQAVLRPGEPQQLDLVADALATSDEAWGMLASGDEFGSYSFTNAAPPFNKLSISGDARGADLTEEDATGEALLWIAQRAESAVASRFDDAWFQLVSVADQSTALEASAPPSSTFRVAPRGIDPDISMGQLWAFVPLPPCSLGER